MRRFPSVKKNSDFQTVYKNGRSYANKLLIMYVYNTGSEETRIGISVSKKVGNSVVRHRVTRLLREIFRSNREQTDSGLDIIVVARGAAKDTDYKKMESAYRHLLGLHNIMKESK
ncbi:MAG: ribonuclease P protein component [Hungatella sp.]|nr:ribonuclease P protein component [Hungatella sp.]